MRGLCRALVALAMAASGALAADSAPPAAKPPMPAFADRWDVDFSGAITSDFVYRGFSISDRGPSVSANVRPRYEWFYAGLAVASVDLPFRPDALMDIYACVRPVFGPLVLELRFTYYHFPGSVAPGTNIPADFDFWQVHARPVLNLSESLSLALHTSHAPDFANTGATETLLSLSPLYKAPAPWLGPGWGWFVSGELAHQWMGTTRTGVDFADYAFWSIGAGLAYKALIFDLRYHDTTMTREECFVLTGDLGAIPGGVPSAANPLGLRSNWCSPAIVGRISFETSQSRLR
jgi:uncharacterized protein (TIGR02001 family)